MAAVDTARALAVLDIGIEVMSEGLTPHQARGLAIEMRAALEVLERELADLRKAPHS